jgi:hypothetical protein
MAWLHPASNHASSKTRRRAPRSLPPFVSTTCSVSERFPSIRHTRRPRFSARARATVSATLRYATRLLGPDARLLQEHPRGEALFGRNGRLRFAGVGLGASLPLVGDGALTVLGDTLEAAYERLRVLGSSRYRYMRCSETVPTSRALFVAPGGPALLLLYLARPEDIIGRPVHV